jgi:LPPG:FO 2-phospho-L-lactate transferase
MLSEGLKLTEITELIKNKFKINCDVLPMSDDKVSTKLITKKGEKLNFQNYFVEKKAKPRLKNVVYEGSRKARVSKYILDTINQSDILIIGPSNPILSIGPILSLSAVNQEIQNHNNVIAISPFVGKKALKGPSVQNFIDMGYTPDIQGLKKYYKNRVNKFYVNHGDSDNSLNVFEEQIVFKNENDSKNLANRILQSE